MEIIYDQTKLPIESCVTLGVFDGVHLGHQSLLKHVNDIAKSNDLQTTVVTFNKHPLSIIAPERAPKMLSSTKRKLELLEESGLVDNVLLIDFNIGVAHQDAIDFIKGVFVNQLNAKVISVGNNFSFGHERKGNVELLKQYSKELGYNVEPIELLDSVTDLNSKPVSSTLIRQYISVGEVALARQCLGRPHELSGVVVHGDHMGRKLGYPTANTEVDASLAVPSDGVYAGKVIVKNKVHKACISIGVRPMFHDDNIRVIEPHILDFDEDIYFENITIMFDAKLRDQQIFSSVDALVAQIEVDCLKTREIVKL
jgi:riboflavin kinase/FMN adenylyltransferase